MPTEDIPKKSKKAAANPKPEILSDEHLNQAKHMKLFRLKGHFPFIPITAKRNIVDRRKMKRRFVFLDKDNKAIMYVAELKRSTCSPWSIHYGIFSIEGIQVMTFKKRKSHCCACATINEEHVREIRTADHKLYPGMNQSAMTGFHLQLPSGAFIGHWKSVEYNTAARRLSSFQRPFKRTVYDDTNFPIMRACAMTGRDGEPVVEILQGVFPIGTISSNRYVQPLHTLVNPAIKDINNKPLQMKDTGYEGIFPVEVHVVDKAIALGLILTEMILEETSF